jgi:hypothetical protein
VYRPGYGYYGNPGYGYYGNQDYGSYYGNQGYYGNNQGYRYRHHRTQEERSLPQRRGE